MNDTQMYLLRVQLEGPHHPQKNKTRTEAATPPAALAARPRPGRGEGGARRPLAGQTAGGCRAESAVALRAAEVSHLCLTQAGGRGRECGSLSIDPEPVLAGHGLGRQERCYHSFFFSSMETPPGPRATTSSKPPITDMVWKKSYLRKSCMGL